jgi:hypothetical protein
VVEVGTHGVCASRHFRAGCLESRSLPSCGSSGHGAGIEVSGCVCAGGLFGPLTMRRYMRRVGVLHCLLQLAEACKDFGAAERSLFLLLVGIEETPDSEC